MQSASGQSYLVQHFINPTDLSVKCTSAQEGKHLRDYVGIVHHKRVGHGQHDMVRHARQRRRLDGHLAVILTRQ